MRDRAKDTNPERRKRIIVRVVKLVVMCQAYRYLPTLSELADLLRANPRTIRRDLEAIEEAGIPVPPRIDEYKDIA